ncbi:hypothetical protein JCM1840_003539 [Sporobolomyces johnsonii]
MAPLGFALSSIHPASVTQHPPFIDTASSTIFRSTATIACDPTTLIFGGGVAPHVVSIVAFAAFAFPTFKETDHILALDEHYQLVEVERYVDTVLALSSSGTAVWDPENVPAGREIVFKVVDSEGSTGYSMKKLIVDGFEGAPGCRYRFFFPPVQVGAAAASLVELPRWTVYNQVILAEPAPPFPPVTFGRSNSPRFSSVSRLVIALTCVPLWAPAVVGAGLAITVAVMVVSEERKRYLGYELLDEEEEEGATLMSPPPHSRTLAPPCDASTPSPRRTLFYEKEASKDVDAAHLASEKCQLG